MQTRLLILLYSDYLFIGGIVGKSLGMVQGCNIVGEINAEASVYCGPQSWSSLQYYNDINIGGVAGELTSSKIEGCTSEIKIIEKSKSSVGNDGSYYGHNHRYYRTGGIVGRNYGAVENCSATGNIQSSYTGSNQDLGARLNGGIAGLVKLGGSLNNVCSSVNITNLEGAYGYFGGIAGWCESGCSVKNAAYYGTIDVSVALSQGYAGGLVGKNLGALSQALAKGNLIGSAKGIGDAVGLNDTNGSVSRIVNEGNLQATVGTNSGSATKCYIIGVDVLAADFYDEENLYEELALFNRAIWGVLPGQYIYLKSFAELF